MKYIPEWTQVGTFFKLLKHNIKGGILKYEIARVLIEIGESPEWGVVVWVDERQVFDIEHGDDVRSVSLVDRNTRITLHTHKSISIYIKMKN